MSSYFTEASENLVCVDDYEVAASKIMSKEALGFSIDYAGDGQTYLENCSAFKRYLLRPQPLKDVSSVDLSTEMYGKKIAFPVCVAPWGFQKLIHEDAEVATARATASMETGLALSLWTSIGMDVIAKETPHSLKWIQIGLAKDMEYMTKLLKCAENSSFDGVIVTIDHPVTGTRYTQSRNKFPSTSTLSFPHAPKNLSRDKSSGKFSFCEAATWSDLATLKELTNLPMILKGVLDGETARKAMEYAVDGIIVSNHGGRQLDGVPATIDVLSEVVAAVDGKCNVFLDGGIRNGTDILKAIALGAKAVFVGRPVLWGLACNGEDGVRNVLSLLKDEFKTALQLMGFTSIDELQSAKNAVVHQHYFHRCNYAI